jgi:hypothetical protein
MMRPGRRASLSIALFLLASAATAHAECAWVLWEQTSFPETIDWRILRTYDVRALCAADHAKLMSPNSVWHAGYEPLSEDSVIQRLPTGVIAKRALCLPDTVDPRGPKGK